MAYYPIPGKVTIQTRKLTGSKLTMELWPGLLALAIALNLAEVILRKWSEVSN